MLRNCSIAIAVWIVLFLGYSFCLFQSDLPFEGALFGGALMSSLVGFGLAMLNGARHATRDRRALARFHRGERPRDGELAAVAGEIRPAFEPLYAPFSGRECVLYRYDIGPHRGGNQDVARDYAGFALARCAIHTPYGTFALGSFPVLNGFPEEHGDGDRAQEYVDATTFEEFSNVVTLAKVALELCRQPPPLRLDGCLGKAPESVRGGEAKEAIVASGAAVTAYGRYSSATNALVNGTKDKDYLRLHAGSTLPVAAGAISQSITGIVLIVVANVGMWLVLSKLASR
jgi:hypothetical protein